MPDRDAAPAAEGADALEALAILKEQHPSKTCNSCEHPHVICLGHGYHAEWPCDEGLVIGLAEQGLAARPAPAAATEPTVVWGPPDPVHPGHAVRYGLSNGANAAPAAAAEGEAQRLRALLHHTVHVHGTAILARCDECLAVAAAADGVIPAAPREGNYARGYERALCDVERKAEEYRHEKGVGWRNAAIGMKVAVRSLRDAAAREAARGEGDTNGF